MDCAKTLWSYIIFPFTSFGELNWLLQISVFIAVIAFVLGADILRAVYRFGLRFMPFIKVNLDDDDETDTLAEILAENIIGLILLLTGPYTFPLLCAYLLGIWLKNNLMRLFRIIGGLAGLAAGKIGKSSVGQRCARIWKLGDNE